MPEGQSLQVDYRLERDIAVLSTEMKNVRSDLDEIKVLLKGASDQSVTKRELEDKIDPIRRIVYTMTGAVLLAFVSAVVALVWKTTS